VSAVGRREDLSLRWYVKPGYDDADRYESVTTIISAANDSSFKLVPWSATLTAEAAVAHHEFLGTSIAEAGYGPTVAWLGEVAERRRKLASRIGTYQHDVIEALILDKPSLPVVPDELVDVEIGGERVDLDAISDGFLQFVADHDPVWHLAEATVADHKRRTAGTLDIVMELPAFAPGHRLCIADVKTGRWLNSTMSAQLAAYRFADEVWLDDLGNTAPMVPVDFAAILHLRREYRRGYKLFEVPAGERELSWFDLMAAQFHAGQDYGAKLHTRALYPARPDGSQPPPLLEDTALRCRNALIEAGLTDMTEVSALTLDALAAIKGVGPKALDDITALLASLSLGPIESQVA